MDSEKFSKIEVLHNDACQRSVPGYIDPESGLFVMTAVYLKNRGFCCGNACRHCPYIGTPAQHPDRSSNATKRDSGIQTSRWRK